MPEQGRRKQWLRIGPVAGVLRSARHFQRPVCPLASNNQSKQSGQRKERTFFLCWHVESLAGAGILSSPTPFGCPPTGGQGLTESAAAS
jgi:hypothetical protein